MSENDFVPGPGPYDFEEVEPLGAYLDFGRLLLPIPPAGLKVNLEYDTATGKGMAVTLEEPRFSLQVSVFSATKSGGQWQEVMEQLEASIASQGGKTRRDHSSLGITLHIETPVQDAGGKVEVKQMRVLGFEGNRWLLRGILTGDAVNDIVIATEVEALFRSWVVRRGDDAMPPLELLELSLPADAPPIPKAF